MDKETYKTLQDLRRDPLVYDNPLDTFPPIVLSLVKDGLVNEVELKGSRDGKVYVVSEKGRAAMAWSRWRFLFWLGRNVWYIVVLAAAPIFHEVVGFFARAAMRRLSALFGM